LEEPEHGRPGSGILRGQVGQGGEESVGQGLRGGTRAAKQRGRGEERVVVVVGRRRGVRGVVRERVAERPVLR